MSLVKVPKKEKPAAAPAKAGEKAAESVGVTITMEEPVQLSFALRYLNTFAKGAALSDRVQLHLAKEQPCMIEYKIGGLGFLRYYLAPKVDDAEAGTA